MRITTAKGHYDLPTNFVLELERKNPFFSQIAEKSIPVTLPPTANNLRIIGYNNIDSKNKPVTSIAVIIEDGITRLFARQVIHKTSKEGISTTFYPNIGAFWATIRDKKLKDIFTGVVYSSSTLMADFQNSMKSTSNFDFVVFPVACNNGSDDYFIINQTENVSSGGTPYLLGRKARTITEGSKNTSVPLGYGITPFLKLHIVLNRVISHFGYTIENSFLTEGLFKNLVLLNNCADTVVKDIVDYSQIVPDISVQDLLDIIRSKFGCEFIPNEEDKSIKISFIKNQLNQHPVTDLSSVKVSEVEFDLPSFSQLSIVQDVSLDNASVEMETIEKFIEKYKLVGAVNESEWADQAIVSRYNAVLRLAEGRFYSIEFDGISTRRVPVSSVFFNYNKGGELTLQEIQLKDTAVPIVQAGQELMPFVGNIIHKNTAISEKSTKKEETLKYTMLCFAKFYSIDSLQYSFGTPLNFNKDGIRDSDYSLQTWGEDGIFKRFYKELDSFYRHSNIQVHTDLLLSEAQKNNISEIEPVLINNQVLLPDTISYTIGKKIQKKCIFRTMKLYEPVDTTTEQSIPVLVTDHDSAIYFWDYKDNSSTVVPPTQGLDEYIYRLAGEVVRPVLAPTEQQYNDSLNGVKFFEDSVDIVIEHYVMSNLVSEDESRLDYWYTVSLK